MSPVAGSRQGQLGIKPVEKTKACSDDIRLMGDLDPGGCDPKESTDGAERGNVLEPVAGFGMIGGVNEFRHG